MVMVSGLGPRASDLSFRCYSRSTQPEAVSEAVEAASDAAAHPEGTEFSLGGSLALRPHGSVVCSLHPFEGVSLGTVGRHVMRAKMFSNCHLHPHCEIHVGVAREEVSRMRLAQWLATGYPSKGLPAEERRRLGAQHRAQWSRYGPLGEMGPLGIFGGLMNS